MRNKVLSSNDGYEFAIENGKMQYARGKFLGRGGSGQVFHGYFNETEVAVKRILIDETKNVRREIGIHTRLKHKNVLNIFAIESDKDFRYLALELCIASLMDVIENKYTGTAVLPSDVMKMYQVADGLEYIHRRKLVHRDLKPPNILISLSGDMKISDFGDSKEIGPNGFYSYSGFRGTVPWMAPEVLRFCLQLSPNNLANPNDENNIFTSSSDVFSVGCIFFTLVKKGKHPFGDEYSDVQNNIVKDDPVNIGCLMDDDLAASTIRRMLSITPADRMSIRIVKESLEKITSVSQQHGDSKRNQAPLKRAPVKEPTLERRSKKTPLKRKREAERP